MQHRSGGEVLHRLEAARQNLALAAPNFGHVARYLRFLEINSHCCNQF